MKPMQPPYPRGYDADAKCSYHGGGVGHSIERCLAFKYKVQALIDFGWLKFQEDKPSIEANPTIWALIKVGLLKGDYDVGITCALHPDDGHSIEECVEFEDILQDLLDRSLMQVCHKDNEEEVFTQIGVESDVTLPEPLMIHFTRTTPTSVAEGKPSVVIRAPSPFPYKSEKVVPWRYGAHALDEGKGTDPAIENISGIGGMTRSGRIFTPSMVTKEGTNNNETTMAAKAKEFLKGNGVQAEETPDKEEKKEISEEEACEFLKFIQQSEYKVVEQLNRMPARISLLELLMHSTSHRKLLMKILSEAHVEQGVSLNKFEGIIGNIIANNYLTFTDEEIPTKGRGHNKALHVFVKCLDHVIARVLMDNGSSLNVMPKTTLEKLPCDGMHMKPSSMIVRAAVRGK
ncbi:uncharacterized protein LOC128197475 [Vigna angularis]|uniref:uncharacterized protein LOC128197475 n=1 Tax=Phaseolus angularis TaxID=3914 RepID=UPI0022B2E154|nr:uncharacterized protein LOC128197475 [Vigna angularis]